MVGKRNKGKRGRRSRHRQGMVNDQPQPGSSVDGCFFGPPPALYQRMWVEILIWSIMTDVSKVHVHFLQGCGLTGPQCSVFKRSVFNVPLQECPCCLRCRCLRSLKNRYGLRMIHAMRGRRERQADTIHSLLERVWAGPLSSAACMPPEIAGAGSRCGGGRVPGRVRQLVTRVTRRGVTRHFFERRRWCRCACRFFGRFPLGFAWLFPALCAGASPPRAGSGRLLVDHGPGRVLLEAGMAHSGFDGWRGGWRSRPP